MAVYCPILLAYIYVINPNFRTYNSSLKSFIYSTKWFLLRTLFMSVNKKLTIKIKLFF